jgi:hypothetical protein
MLRYHRSQRGNEEWPWLHDSDLQVRVQLNLVDAAPDNQQTCIETASCSTYQWRRLPLGLLQRRFAMDVLVAATMGIATENMQYYSNIDGWFP